MIKIRPMTIADYPEVYVLWQDTEKIRLQVAEDSPEGIAAFLKRNPHTSFVAREGTQLIGALLCGHDGRRGYLYHAAVRRDRRGQGIGRRLVRAALTALEHEGIRLATLMARGYEKNGAFWESVGWTERENLLCADIAVPE